MVNFLMRKIFHGNLNEAIALAEIDVNLKKQFQPMKLLHLDFHGKFSLEGNRP